jgi:hypothetical protein
MVVMGVEQGQCAAETIVRLKHETTTTMSHAALATRAEYLRFAPEGSLQAVKWTKLAEKLYGEPAAASANPSSFMVAGAGFEPATFGL